MSAQKLDRRSRKARRYEHFPRRDQEIDGFLVVVKIAMSATGGRVVLNTCYIVGTGKCTSVQEGSFESHLGDGVYRSSVQLW